MNGPCVAFGVVRTIRELFDATGSSDLILIDIPIGLPHAPGERRCDLEARKALSPRGACVFPVPCREALEAPDYVSACRINARILGRKLSKQTWGICPKIREVDEALRSVTRDRARVRETHPEVCFWALNGYRPVPRSKKTKEGLEARLALLDEARPRSWEVVGRAFAKHRRHGVKMDDIVDAFVAAVTARCSSAHLAGFPALPQRDTLGLPMEIVYPGAGGQ
jgi:predicted RNase H-like nuclease